MPKPRKLPANQIAAASILADEGEVATVGLDVDGRDHGHAGRSTLAVNWVGSRTIFTGMRCTTFVKLPVALSGGSSANSCPLAGDRLSMRPRKRCPGYMSTLIATGCPGRTCVNCVSL